MLSLKGAIVNVSSFGIPPYIIRSSNGTALQAGVDIDIINIVGQKLKFTPNFVLSKTWGSRNQDSGQWVGTVGEVRDQLINLNEVVSNVHLIIRYCQEGQVLV